MALYSVSPKLPEYTQKQMKLISFPLYRSLPVSQSPTPLYTPLHWESQPHPPILVILCIGAQGAGCAPRSLLLGYVCLAHKDSKLPVFILY